MDTETLLSALTPAIESVDSYCSWCVRNFCASANRSLRNAGSTFGFHYDGEKDTVTVLAMGDLTDKDFTDPD